MDEIQKRELIELKNLMLDQQRDLRDELRTAQGERVKVIQGYLRDLEITLRDIDKDLSRR